MVPQLKIGFVYNAPCNIVGALQQPENDTVAATVYLAMQLAKLGHDITIFSQNPNNLSIYAIRSCNISMKDQSLALDPAILEPDYTVLIFMDTTVEVVKAVKAVLKSQPKLYIWTSLSHESPEFKSLVDPNALAEINCIVCVSDWQKHNLIEDYPIPRDKVAIIEFAISPFFEDLFNDGKELVATKSKAPSLAYTAKPDDGLEILLDVITDVTTNYQDVAVNIFSDMHVAGTDEKKFEGLLNLATHTKGINYIGALSKIKLAGQLRSSTILAYPCIIPTTSNVAVLEAMAAGLYIVTSNIGSIPSYCHQHGKNIADDLLRANSLDSFISEVLAICQTQTHSSAAFYDYCYKQSLEVNKKYTWRMKAREWIDLIENGVVKDKEKTAVTI